MSATASQRRERVIKEVFEHRHLTARDLASVMGVSEATVRRDLKLLADAGELDLVYGGATIPRGNDSSFRSKSLRNTEAKQIIGRLAADLVPDEDQLFLDSGTTSFNVAPFLKRRRG